MGHGPSRYDFVTIRIEFGELFPISQGKGCLRRVHQDTMGLLTQVLASSDPRFSRCRLAEAPARAITATRCVPRTSRLTFARHTGSDTTRILWNHSDLPHCHCRRKKLYIMRGESSLGLVLYLGVSHGNKDRIFPM